VSEDILDKAKLELMPPRMCSWFISFKRYVELKFPPKRVQCSSIEWLKTASKSTLKKFQHYGIGTPNLSKREYIAILECLEDS